MYAIGVADAETIGALVRAIEGPVSVLARGGGPGVAELEALGVRRVSIGPWAFRAVSSLTRQIGEELLRDGTYRFAEWQPYPDLNALLSRHEVGTDT